MKTLTGLILALGIVSTLNALDASNALNEIHEYESLIEEAKRVVELTNQQTYRTKKECDFILQQMP